MEHLYFVALGVFEVFNYNVMLLHLLWPNTIRATGQGIQGKYKTEIFRDVHKPLYFGGCLASLQKYFVLLWTKLS